MKTKSHLRKAWESFLKGFQEEVSEETASIERAMAFARMREQLWDALDNAEETADKWAWPIDIFVDDDGSLFSIVAQAGKLFQIPISVANDSMTLGEWVQVTEVFTPVQQSALTIRRTADGQFRFAGVAATSVLNRVAQIDSRSLFDSFIEDTAETGNWPRVDFYHLGRYNTDAWEFGTVDFHARDGYCYIVSGVLDEGHPLAQAAIYAYGKEPEKWGFSIEFYAFGEPEVIVVDPEVRVPVYEKGRIIRVSIVKECDAASLFTRIGNITEETTRMKREIKDALSEFFGTDEAASKFLENFGIEVDEINRTVDDDKLVHRTKTKPAVSQKRTVATAKKLVAAAADTRKDDENDDEDEDEEDTEEEQDGDEAEEEQEDKEAEPIELDEEAMQQLAKDVVATPDFQKVLQSITDLKKQVKELTTARTADAKEIAVLKAAAKKASTRLATVERDEDDKKSDYQKDMPSRSSRKATYRPRENYDDEGEDENSSDIAERTMAKIPNRY